MKRTLLALAAALSACATAHPAMDRPIAYGAFGLAQGGEQVSTTDVVEGLANEADTSDTIASYDRFQKARLGTIVAGLAAGASSVVVLSQGSSPGMVEAGLASGGAAVGLGLTSALLHFLSERALSSAIERHNRTVESLAEVRCSVPDRAESIGAWLEARSGCVPDGGSAPLAVAR